MKIAADVFKGLKFGLQTLKFTAYYLTRNVTVNTANKNLSFKSSLLRIGSWRVRLSKKSFVGFHITERDEGPLSTSSLAVGRFAAKKGSLRSPRGRLVASLLPGIPIKNSNNRKIVSARGTMGRGKKRELPLFLPPILPRALTVFLLPSLPTTQRDLCGGERVWELAGRNSTLNTQKYKNLFTQANQAGSYVLVTVKLR